MQLGGRIASTILATSYKDYARNLLNKDYLKTSAITYYDSQDIPSPHTAARP